MPIEAFTLTSGSPFVYNSSSWGERHFCGTCEAQLLYRDSEAPKRVVINVGSLDDPGRQAELIKNLTAL